MGWDEHVKKCQAEALELLNLEGLPPSMLSMMESVRKHEGYKSKEPEITKLIEAAIQIAAFSKSSVRQWIEEWDNALNSAPNK